MLMPGRRFTTSTYRYGFNGKENENDIKGEGNEQDYGMRIYDSRIGKFLSVDPLAKSYPELTPYQFSSNTPIQAIDLDGKEAVVSYIFSTITKDRTEIEVTASVSIKIQVINLSSIANSDIDLQNLSLNLSSDLASKLSGKHSSLMTVPFEFKSKGNYISSVEIVNRKINYKVTFNTFVTADVKVIDDFSKINKHSWVFALVDNIVYPEIDVAGLADNLGGRVALGEVEYFNNSKVYDEGRSLAFHEILHLLGADDSYPPNTGYPGTQNKDNAMYNSSSGSKRNLTDDQIVRDIWTNTIGGLFELFSPTPYKQPFNSNYTLPTSEQLKIFLEKYANTKKK